MKKNLVVTVLIVTNLVTAIGLGYVAWRRMLWQFEAMHHAQFAANLWAGNNHDKDKLTKLNLVVKDEPEVDRSEATRFDGSYVVIDWVGYTDPLWGGSESPSLLVAKTFVTTY